MAAQPSACPWDTPAMAALMEMAEEIMGKFAQDMIGQSGLPTQVTVAQKLVVLDNACGSGVVTKQLLAKDLLDNAAHAKLQITCLDLAEAMVMTTKKWAAQSGVGNVTVIKGDAMDTGLPSAGFDFILWNFGPFLLPRPYDGVRECLRMLQPGGTLGITSWSQVAWFDEYKTVFDANPHFPPYPKDMTFMKTFSETGEDWHKPDDVKQHLETLGFENVQTSVTDNFTSFTMERTRSSLEGSLGMIKDRFWTPEQKAEFSTIVDDAVMKHLREKYSDGVVNWHWKAIIATGRKPT